MRIKALPVTSNPITENSGSVRPTSQLKEKSNAMRISIARTKPT